VSTHHGEVTKAAILCAERADGNLAKWGLQDLLTLIAAATEELGECAREVLEERRVGARLDRVAAEAVDLGALCCQIVVAAREGMAARGPAGVAYRVPEGWQIADGMPPAAEGTRPPGPPVNGAPADTAEYSRVAAAPVGQAGTPAVPVPWFAAGQVLARLAWELAESAKAAADPARDGSPGPLAAVDAAAAVLVETAAMVYAREPEAVRRAILDALPALSVGKRERELARRIRLVVDGQADQEPVGVCPKCGAAVPQDERTCPRCGLREEREGK